MIGSRSPPVIQQFHVPEFVERNAAPVLRRSHRLETAFAFSAVRIAKHSELPLLIPSQPVRTKPTVAIVINSMDWPMGFHGRAHNPVNILPIPLLPGSATPGTPSDYCANV